MTTDEARDQVHQSAILLLAALNLLGDDKTPLECGLREAVSTYLMTEAHERGML